MRDTKKEIRLGVYGALNGNVSYESSNVPVYEEKLPSNANPDRFILLKSQQEVNEEGNDSCFITKSSIDIEITEKTGSEVSKDAVDGIYNEVMQLLLPTPTTIGFTIDNDFKIDNGIRESCVTDTVQITDTETVITERFRLVFTITQK